MSGTAATPHQRLDAPLAELTTLRLGGPARRVVEATSDEHIIEVIASADADGEPVLVLAGGSNLVISDAGFAGTVLRILTHGVETRVSDDGVVLTVAAGEPWDDLVAGAVADGVAGIECLAGIPGSMGATPIQNVGAYGQEVAEVITSVRAYDRSARKVVELMARECGFAYRSSMFRRSVRYIVLGVTLELERSPLGSSIRYPELARALGVGPGGRAALGATREAVLALRRGKGMVIDPDDPDSVSAGSFFLNPVLSAEEFAALEQRVVERVGDAVRPPGWPHANGRFKTSAAWLIERAGFHRGFARGRVAISGKHTLALVNRGGATTADLVALAREIRHGVREAFGVTLSPEPTLVGITF